jgi:hypothetical protein
LIGTKNHRGQRISLNGLRFEVCGTYIFINGNKAEDQKPAISSIQHNFDAVGTTFNRQLGPCFAVHRHEITKELGQDGRAIKTYLGSLATDEPRPKKRVSGGNQDSSRNVVEILNKAHMSLFVRPFIHDDIRVEGEFQVVIDSSEKEEEENLNGTLTTGTDVVFIR